MWGRRGIAPRIINLGSRWWWWWLATRPGRSTPKEPAFRTHSAWAPDPVWTLCKNSLVDRIIINKLKIFIPHKVFCSIRINPLCWWGNPSNAVHYHNPKPIWENTCRPFSCLTGIYCDICFDEGWGGG